LNKCKTCTKKDSDKREKNLRATNPKWIEKEKLRAREKYNRLNYKEKQKPTALQNYISMKKHRDRYPEKYKARCAVNSIKRNVKENHLHHWSYNKGHYKDVIELSEKEHNKLHRYIIYDQERKMYRTTENILLDTKEAHINYYNSLKELL
jgi:hypothetical protein